MKGFFGELIVSFLGWLRLDKDIYKKINNITIWDSGSSTQVGHVLVSMYGIFVVETKNLTVAARNNDAGPTINVNKPQPLDQSCLSW